LKHCKRYMSVRCETRVYGAGDPVQWTLRGLITSQLGNLDQNITQLVQGGTTSPKEFILDNVSHISSFPL